MLLRQTILYLPAQIIGPLAQMAATIVWTYWLQPEALGAYVGQRFTLANMAEGVLAGYREAIATKVPVQPDADRPAARFAGSRG